MKLYTLRQVAQDLLNEICAMGNHLIVTVHSDYMGTQSYDILDGAVGHNPLHQDLLVEHLEENLTTQGAVMVRKFLDETMEIDTPNGRMEVPIKELYAAFCLTGAVHRLGEDAVQMAQETDGKTGEALSPEPAVVYCAWPEPDVQS